MNFATGTVLTGADAVAAETLLTVEELSPHFPQLDIIECLGRGGMGVVYKARQRSLNRMVALKLLAPERVADAKFAERFAIEAQALARLNHPSIVTIHDFGQVGGFYFLLMEFVDGVNLRQAMKARRFTPEQALAVVPPVCEALQYAHDHGIVHRDIKPENLLLDKSGRAKIADFGVAKLLHAGGSDAGFADSQPAGTPQYMAPEQKARRSTDHRADIYSLGVVLYEMLTGELPADKLQPPSRKVQIDVRLDEIVLRALEGKPELRYQTAGELLAQVETMTRREPAQPSGIAGKAFDESSSATPADQSKSGWLAPFRRFSRLLGLALLLAGLVSGGFQLRELKEANRIHVSRLNSLAAEIPRLQKRWHGAKAEEHTARTALQRFEVNAVNARTAEERQQNEIRRIELQSNLAEAVKRGDDLLQAQTATHEARVQLRFPGPGTLTRMLWAVVPLLVGGLFLMFWRGLRANEAEGGQARGKVSTSLPRWIESWIAIPTARRRLMFQTMLVAGVGMTIAFCLPHRELGTVWRFGAGEPWFEHVRDLGQQHWVQRFHPGTKSFFFGVLALIHWICFSRLIVAENRAGERLRPTDRVFAFSLVEAANGRRRVLGRNVVTSFFIFTAGLATASCFFVVLLFLAFGRSPSPLTVLLAIPGAIGAMLAIMTWRALHPTPPRTQDGHSAPGGHRGQTLGHAMLGFFKLIIVILVLTVLGITFMIAVYFFSMKPGIIRQGDSFTTTSSSGATDRAPVVMVRPGGGAAGKFDADGRPLNVRSAAEGSDQGKTQRPPERTMTMGVGLGLREEGERIIVTRVVPRNSADASGALIEGDTIIGVGQEDELPVPVAGMDVKKVEDLIIGRTGTVVRVTFISASQIPADDRLTFSSVSRTSAKARTVSLVRGAVAPPRSWADGDWLTNGMHAPEILFTVIETGRKTRLSDFRDKIVVLQFWAPWCIPSYGAMDQLQELWTANPHWKDKVATLTATYGDTNRLARQLKARGWIQTLNTHVESSIAENYHVETLPAVYVIDAAGRIVAARNRLDVSQIVNGLGPSNVHRGQP